MLYVVQLLTLWYTDNGTSCDRVMHYIYYKTWSTTTRDRIWVYESCIANDCAHDAIWYSATIIPLLCDFFYIWRWSKHISPPPRHNLILYSITRSITRLIVGSGGCGLNTLVLKVHHGIIHHPPRRSDGTPVSYKKDLDDDDMTGIREGGGSSERSARAVLGGSDNDVRAQSVGALIVKARISSPPYSANKASA